MPIVKIFERDERSESKAEVHIENVKLGLGLMLELLSDEKINKEASKAIVVKYEIVPTIVERINKKDNSFSIYS